ncbi:hypothetical protein D3C75_1038180 [compost metagenome]
MDRVAGMGDEAPSSLKGRRRCSRVRTRCVRPSHREPGTTRTFLGTTMATATTRRAGRNCDRRRITGRDGLMVMATAGAAGRVTGPVRWSSSFLTSTGVCPTVVAITFIPVGTGTVRKGRAMWW